MKSITRHSWYLGVAILLLGLLVRLVPMGRYVTPDEPIWVLRAVHFADAVAAHEWGAIPQTGHPGLTTMVLGALGVRFTMWLHPIEVTEHLAWIRKMAWLAPENGTAFTHLAYFLPAGRLLVAIVNSLGLLWAYYLARSRLGESAARLMVCFLALDPFLAGHAGLLHTDALQATFSFLALLLIIPRRNATDNNMVITPQLCLAALCLALAGLTKTLGFLIAPGMVLVMLFAGKRVWQQRILRVVCLTSLTILFYVLFYPPAWQNLRDALTPLLGAVNYHEGIGLRKVFFAGRMTSNPGPSFYPVVLAFRLTPAVLVGLGIALWARLQRKRALPWIWFVLPAALYLAGITLPTKKFDRYALTLIPPLTALAAAAWALRPAYQRRLAVSIQLLAWALVAPLPLYTADPLLGGPWIAQHIIPLGWGEGEGLAAAYLERTLATASQATLLTKSVPSSAPFFTGETRVWDKAQLACADALITKDLPSNAPSNTRMAKEICLAGIHLTTAYTHIIPVSAQFQQPVLSAVRLPGLATHSPPAADQEAVQGWLAECLDANRSFTWIHTPACAPLTEVQLRDVLTSVVRCRTIINQTPFSAENCTLTAPLPMTSAYQARFGGTLDLLTAVLPALARAPKPVALRLRWQPQTLQQRLTYHVTLRTFSSDCVWAEGGGVLVDERTWPTSVWSPGDIVDSQVYLPLPLSLPPGTYTLTLSLTDGENRRMGLWYPDGTFGGTTLQVGEVRIAPPPYPAEALPDLTPLDGARFPGLKLIGSSTLPDQVWSGASLPFCLGWERTSGNVPAFLHWDLLCAGTVQEEGLLPLAPGNPQDWPPGHRYVTYYAPRTDPTIPQGLCTLRVALRDAAPVILGSLTLRARERQFVLLNMPRTPLTVTVGTFATLSGVDIPVELISGATFTTTLYWQARNPATLNYTVFIHLIGPDGQTWAQADAEPLYGAAPTTSWVAEQYILDSHVLILPPDAPAGTYTLFVGLYDAESGGRVPLYDSTGVQLPDDRALAGTINVTR